VTFSQWLVDCGSSPKQLCAFLTQKYLMNPLPHFFRRNRLFFFNQLLGEKIKIWITGSKDIAIEQSMQNCVPNQFFYWYQSVYHWGLVRIDTPIALEDEQCVTISISCQNNILIG
jgi:hypothetical protein